MNFTDPTFLTQHIQSTLAFYEPNVFDPSGGFYQNFSDDGSLFDAKTRHLVSSTRFVFNYALAAKHFNNATYQQWARHGLTYLFEVHYQPSTGGFAWMLEDDNGQRTITDAQNHCYGLAFVMVAGATAVIAGIPEGQNAIDKAWETMTAHFWEPEHGLYADEANLDFSEISDYRGQNANMHATEGLIWAYWATRDPKYLERAMTIAKSLITLSEHRATAYLNEQNEAVEHLTKGQIWEHYDRNWHIDWDYNIDDKTNIFKPWGFQPGHQTEWAKLLCQLYELDPQPWLLEKAEFLFNEAIEAAWDAEHGGIIYGYAPDKSLSDGDKYFWVQAESFAAAYRLYKLTGKMQYLNWYNKIWQYSWAHMIDHQYGAWFRILSRDNQKLETTKSPVGKTDYHTMGACYDVFVTMMLG